MARRWFEIASRWKYRADTAERLANEMAGVDDQVARDASAAAERMRTRANENMGRGLDIAAWRQEQKK